MQYPSMTDESTLWKGSPSQWLNLGSFTTAAALAIGIIVGVAYFPDWIVIGSVAFVAPLLYVTWRYLVVRCQVYELTSQRLRITTGVINQQIDEIELYRVKDTLTIRTWWMRLTGLATIAMQTSDRTIPHLLIPAIRNGVDLREQLRKQVEAQRDAKRVREMDFDETGEAEGTIDDVPSAG
jgi:uncharacterized membrane protein YdbT with pleckstrin-like domain